MSVSARHPLRAAALGATLVLLLSSCALFKPQRVEVAAHVTETLAPEPLAQPRPSMTVVRRAGATTVFIPGKRAASNKANYASAPGVGPSAIKLGIIVPMDGPAAALGKPLYRTTQAYVQAANARGGINGRKIELFLQTACINCEAENLLAAKALVEQKGVFAIVNTYMNTYAFSAAMKYINERGVPLIQGWTGTGDERIAWGAQQTPWSVYFTVRNDDAVEIYANWMDTVLDQWAKAGKLPNPANPKWVATVGLDVSQDNRRGREFKRVWEARGSGYKVVSQQRVAAEEETVTRMDSFVAAMKDAKANGAFSSSNITLVFGMQAASRQSWKVPWVAKSAWGRAATDNCGAACDGGYTDNNGWGWAGLETPQMQQYLTTMRKYFPDGARYPDAQTLGGWLGMMAFEYAAGRLGADLTRQALIDILGHLRNFDTGIGATITTDDDDHLGMRETMMLQICDNRFYRVSGWLSARGPTERVDSSGDCGWGY